MSGSRIISSLLHLQGLLVVQEGCRGCCSHFFVLGWKEGEANLGAESVSVSNSALGTNWPELGHMTIPAARKARIHHFYSGWQWTQLKIRALLLKRTENGCGSLPSAIVWVPLSVLLPLCAPCWWVKASLLKVGGPRTSSPSITWKRVRNADSQPTPDLLN